MRIFEIIQEARKNPHLNPKTSINQILIDRLNATQDEIAGTKNLFISFTQIDKLGINPQSKYNTPLGIYCYPVEYAYNRVGVESSTKRLPFAGESPYANIFSIKGNIIDLTHMTHLELDEYYQKIINVCKNFKIKTEDIQEIIDSASVNSLNHNNGGHFWFVTMKVSELLAKMPDWGAKKKPVSWTRLFKMLGIDGFVDIGNSIIHFKEPTQAVLFNIKSIVNNQRYYNKYSPESVNFEKEIGLRSKKTSYEVIQQLKDILQNSNNENQLYDFIKNMVNFRHIKLNLIPKKLLLRVLRNDPSLIIHKSQVPVDIQNFLIELHLNNIRYIKNPSMAIQLKVLDQKSDAIQYIKNPPEQIQAIAVKKDPENIQYIENPSERIQIIAVKNNPSTIQHITSPPESVQLIAVKSGNFKYIILPSERIKWLAVQLDIRNIQHIIHPTEEMIDLLNQQSENIQAEIVTNNIFHIKHIKNPSMLVQRAAIKEDPMFAMDYIDLTLEEIQIELINHDIRIIQILYQKNIPISDKVKLFIKDKLEKTSNYKSLIPDTPVLLNYLPEKIQLEYINIDTNYASYITNFSEDLLIELMDEQPWWFFHRFMFKNSNNSDIINKLKKIIPNLPEDKKAQVLKNLPFINN